MQTKSLTQAVLAHIKDAQMMKRIFKCGHASVEYYSDYIDAEYRIRGTLREIPEHSADEWRMFSSQDELVFVLTYYFEEE